jgi:hypothetical protein
VYAVDIVESVEATISEMEPDHVVGWWSRYATIGIV